MVPNLGQALRLGASLQIQVDRLTDGGAPASSPSQSAHRRPAHHCFFQRGREIRFTAFFPGPADLQVKIAHPLPLLIQHLDKGMVATAILLRRQVVDADDASVSRAGAHGRWLQPHVIFGVGLR